MLLRTRARFTLVATLVGLQVETNPFLIRRTPVTKTKLILARHLGFSLELHLNELLSLRLHLGARLLCLRLSLRLLLLTLLLLVERWLMDGLFQVRLLLLSPALWLLLAPLIRACLTFVHIQFIELGYNAFDAIKAN
jgi:hypothetical protein